jgi:hypothetical protein
MQRYILNLKAAFAITMIAGLMSCSDDETKPNLRVKIEYSALTPETPYSQLFVDASGNTTVDLTEGNQRYKMFQALNYYSSSSISANTQIQASKLKSMFSNTGSAFTDISTSTISVIGAELNASSVQLKNVVGSSRPAAEADVVRAKIESLFDEMQTASASVTATASAGNAGKLGTFLVDAKGIETIQVIQKSLIGALQLDYISNVLLDKGLNAENHQVVAGKNYTQLEHNWDEAYGLLTLNSVYLLGSTDLARGTTEFGLGSYIWEYNKAGYAKVYPAFLKGRAAIVNNDKAELQAQASIIRTEMEKAIAGAAVGYLDKWKIPGSAVSAQAHAIGEGLGFIYSLRFATQHSADATFSDNLLTGLVGSSGGFWDLSITKINTALDDIKAKFSIQ